MHFLDIHDLLVLVRARLINVDMEPLRTSSRRLGEEITSKLNETQIQQFRYISLCLRVYMYHNKAVKFCGEGESGRR